MNQQLIAPRQARRRRVFGEIEQEEGLTDVGLQRVAGIDTQHTGRAQDAAFLLLGLVAKTQVVDFFPAGEVIAALFPLTGSQLEADKAQQQEQDSHVQMPEKEAGTGIQNEQQNGRDASKAQP